MPSNTAAVAAAAADRTRRRQPAASSQWLALADDDGCLSGDGKTSFCGVPLTQLWTTANLPARSEESARLAITGSPCGRTACVPTTSEVPARTSARTLRPKLSKLPRFFRHLEKGPRVLLNRRKKTVGSSNLELRTCFQRADLAFPDAL